MLPDSEHTNDALGAALAVLDEPLPGPVDYVSYDVRRALLLVGPSKPVLEIARALRHRFDVVAVIDGPRPQARLLGIDVVAATVVTLNGHLGRFSAEANDSDGQPIDLRRHSSNDDGYFDLVMDLSPKPICDQSIPPLGYLRPTDSSQYESALEALLALSGEVRKPRYIDFVPWRCVNRRQQVPGCERCLDTCPAGAITIGEQSVTVDAHLCRGCGACASVCPTGALTFTDPSPSDVVERLERALEAFRSAGGTDPWIVFHTENGAAITRWAAIDGITLLPFAVHSVASLGLEVWLAAIALGAAGAVLLAPENLPAMALGALSRNVDLAGNILESLGQPRGRVQLLNSSAVGLEADVAAPAGGSNFGPPWSYPLTDPNPRSRLLALFERLSARSRDGCERPATTLPASAPFGGVALDAKRCTMCLACTNLCPTGALRTGGDGVELNFVEADCIQCGLCEHGCPEHAVKRQPRFDYAALRDGKMITLNRARMANCTQCKRPYMSAALLASALEHLSGAGAANGQAREMLLICPQCRADNAMKSQFASMPRPRE